MKRPVVGSVTKVIGRIPILDVEPAVDCGSRPAKAVAGETFAVSATAFRDGHGLIAVAAVLVDPSRKPGPLVPMRELAPGTDRYGADVTVTEEGLWRFRVEAWADPIATWHHDAAIKIPAGQDVELMLTEGALLFGRAARRIPQPPGARAPAAARATLRALVARMRNRELTPWERFAGSSDPGVTAALARWPLREFVTRSRSLTVQVDRERALYGAWYEFFPRSEGAQVDQVPPVSGTLRTAAKRLDAIAAMEFDVVYLPPVHPIGTSFRKGRNNTLIPADGDPGSPWAIGSADGGHDAIHPDLGTFADFDAFVARTRELGMEVALDLALQASPDHPWVKEHPEWFTTRADGSIAYAENPPKKYQDIYPLNFDNDPEGIYAEVLRVVRLWMDHGVRIFRVDNPHTKPVRFWERLLTEIRVSDPDVLFLAEAFTRPAMMRTLAKIGFHQSYTYFTWRNGVRGADRVHARAVRRDGPVHAAQLLHQHPGHPARVPAVRRAARVQDPGRAGLDAVPDLGHLLRLRAGRERPAAAGQRGVPGFGEVPVPAARLGGAARDGYGIADYITELNRIRRAHPALHQLRNLRFHGVDQPELMCFSKRTSRIPPSPVTGAARRPRETTRYSWSSTWTRTRPGRPRSGLTCPHSAWTASSS